MLDGYIVRLSDVHTTSGPFQLDLHSLIRPMLDTTEKFKVSLLYYSDDILAVHVTNEGRPNYSHIFAIDTTARPLHGKRVVRALQLASDSRLFVRHNSRYLYYGTHTGIGDDGHHKWEIDGVALYKEHPLPKREHALLLDNFHGTDIGSTVAFEIHNDYFYAVSNQGTFEVEEIDYTSFYHWVRFPVDQPLSEAVESNERLYRRQHQQGPIHDSWTDLTLQIDECTNETVIVESRREWVQASSRQARTFYVTKLGIEDQRLGALYSMEDGVEEQLLPNDIMTTLLDSSNNCNWMETPPQHSWMQHPEFSREHSSPRTFILARTKLRAYNYSCSSFLDLVEDDRCCSDPSKPPCLRLRIGSRREIDPSPPPSKGKERMDDTLPVFEDSTRYRHSPIRMWPPSAQRCPCSARLHNILIPKLSSGPTHTRTVTGVLDDRCLVYMVKAGRSYGDDEDSASGSIVVVDFSRPVAPRCNDMADSACIVDKPNEQQNWQWSPGLEKRCRAGMCR